MIDETLFEAEEKMEKAVSVAREEMSGLRTGRATPNLFNRLLVDYYGTATPIPQMASVSVAEARMAIIKPYDASQLAAMEKAADEAGAAHNAAIDPELQRHLHGDLHRHRSGLGEKDTV